MFRCDTLRTMQPPAHVPDVLATDYGRAVAEFDRALAAAEEFAANTKDTADYLNAISFHADPEESTVVVCGKDNLHDNIRRVTILLTDYLGIENLSYLPVTGSAPKSSFEWKFSETSAYTEFIESADGGPGGWSGDWL